MKIPRKEVKKVPKYLFKHKLDICPSCSQLKEKDIIDELGECLSCDHVRGNVIDDLLDYDCEGNSL